MARIAGLLSCPIIFAGYRLTIRLSAINGASNIVFYILLGETLAAKADPVKEETNGTMGQTTQTNFEASNYG